MGTRVMSHETHASLLGRVAEGIDPAAWTEFHNRYAELIRGFARRQGQTAADCDDIVQEVLLALLKVMPGFRYDPTKGKFRSYLKTVTVRVILQRRRQKGRSSVIGDAESPLPVADDVVDDRWEDEWRSHHIRHAMERIQPEFSLENRRAFSLYAMQGLSVERVADEVGISVNQVYKAKSRILRRLGEVIATQVAEEG